MHTIIAVFALLLAKLLNHNPAPKGKGDPS